MRPLRVRRNAGSMWNTDAEGVCPWREREGCRWRRGCGNHVVPRTRWLLTCWSGSAPGDCGTRPGGLERGVSGPGCGRLSRPQERDFSWSRRLQPRKTGSNPSRSCRSADSWPPGPL